MSTWQVTNRLTGEIVYAYAEEAPDHTGIYPFDTFNHCRVVEVVTPPKRRVTKLEFIGRMGDAAYSYVLELSLSSVEILKWVKFIDWSTPEQDGTSIDLDDPRTVDGLNALEPALIAQGIVSAGWAAGVVA